MTVPMKTCNLCLKMIKDKSFRSLTTNITKKSMGVHLLNWVLHCWMDWFEISV